MAPKVSVIMPMYNAEEYVGLALDTLLKQTFTDFEAILVDDCSTDRTLEIVRSFNDPRVKIIENKKNIGGEGGPGVVRNVGMTHMKGDYIYFLDADDAIFPNALELLVGSLESTKADVIISTSHWWPADTEFQSLEDVELIPRGCNEEGWIEPDLKTRIFRGYCNNKLPVSVYMHLYRKKFLLDNGLKFRKGAIIHEDGIFTIEMYCASKKLYKMNKPFYIYRRQKGSVTRPKELNFKSFAKRVQSFLIVMDSYEEVLTRALKREYGSADHFFIDNVCLSVGKQALLSPMGQFYVEDAAKCWEIVDDEVRKRYGKNNGFLTKMITGYFMSELAYQTLDVETTHMKNMMHDLKDTINKVIPY